MNFHGFLDLQGFLFDSYPPWLVNQNIFPASAGAGTFGFFFKFWGVFFVGKITTRVLGDFFASLLDGWRKTLEKIPTKSLEIIQDFRRSCCILQGARIWIFRPQNWAVLQKHCKPHHNLQPKIRCTLKAEKL